MKITILSTLALAALLASGQFAAAQATATTTTTTTAGTISEFNPDTIVVRTESSPEPIRYSYSKTTTYVDESGAPVSMELVKQGLPVTVHYVKEGNRMVANKVIVRKRTSTSASSPAVQEKRTTTTVAPAPAVEEKKSTTTTTTTK